MFFNKVSAFLILSLGFFIQGKAQSYTIPWATHQPAWVFPVWFENGNGQKDTIYICYDSIDHDYIPDPNQNPDTVFGEKCIYQDLSNGHFHVAIPSNCDSSFLLKTEADQFDSFDSSIWVQIGLLHFVYPIKISWDLSLFYSPALPFHTCSTCPKAMGFIQDDFGYSKPEIPCLPILGYAIAFTDSTLENCGVVRDSIVFDSVVFSNTMGIQGITIKKWRADSLFTDGIKAVEPSLNVFPVPCTDVLNITGTVNLRRASIVDCLGRVLESEVIEGIKQTHIDVKNLAPGFYILRLDTDQGPVSRSIIMN